MVETGKRSQQPTTAGCQKVSKGEQGGAFGSSQASIDIRNVLITPGKIADLAQLRNPEPARRPQLA